MKLVSLEFESVALSLHLTIIFICQEIRDGWNIGSIQNAYIAKIKCFFAAVCGRDGIVRSLGHISCFCFIVISAGFSVLLTKLTKTVGDGCCTQLLPSNTNIRNVSAPLLFM